MIGVILAVIWFAIMRAKEDGKFGLLIGVVLFFLIASAASGN